MWVNQWLDTRVNSSKGLQQEVQREDDRSILNGMFMGTQTLLKIKQRYSATPAPDLYNTLQINPFRYSPSGWVRLIGWSIGCPLRLTN